MNTCEQIRQALDARPANLKTNGWAFACAECHVPQGGQSCWETCGGSPCCCAPLTMTCDFCEIYLEHRRDIAGIMAGANGGPTPDSEISSHPQGGMHLMEKVQFNVPRLWADHHTLQVRAALTNASGVQDVVASSAFRMVIVSYDPALTTPEAISGTLAAAGYPVATGNESVIAQPVPVDRARTDPAWFKLGTRASKTDERDLKTKR